MPKKCAYLITHLVIIGFFSTVCVYAQESELSNLEDEMCAELISKNLTLREELAVLRKDHGDMKLAYKALVQKVKMLTEANEELIKLRRNNEALEGGAGISAVAELQKEIADLKARLRSGENELRIAKSREESAEDDLTRLQEELEARYEFKNKEFDKIKSLEGKLEAALYKQRAAEKEKEELSSGIEALRKEAAGFRHRLDSVRAEVEESMEDEIEARLSVEVKAKAERREKEEKIKALESELKEARKNIKEAEKKAQKKIKDAQEAAEKDIKEAEKKADSSLEKEQKAEALVREAEERIAELEEKLKEQYALIRGKEKAIKAVEDEKKKLAMEEKYARRAQKAAERSEEELRNSVDGIQAKADKERLDAHYNLAIVFDKNGMYEDAEREYLKCLDINPEDADVHYNLAILYDDKLNRSAKALTHYEKFLKLRPKGEDAMQVRNWMFNCEQELRMGPEIR